LLLFVRAFVRAFRCRRRRRRRLLLLRLSSSSSSSFLFSFFFRIEEEGAEQRAERRMCLPVSLFGQGRVFVSIKRSRKNTNTVIIITIRTVSWRGEEYVYSICFCPLAPPEKQQQQQQQQQQQRNNDNGARTRTYRGTGSTVRRRFLLFSSSVRRLRLRRPQLRLAVARAESRTP